MYMALVAHGLLPAGRGAGEREPRLLPRACTAAARPQLRLWLGAGQAVRHLIDLLTDQHQLERLLQL